MFRIELLSPNVQVANLARIHQLSAPDRWFRSFLAKLQPLRLPAANWNFPEPTRSCEPTRLSEDDVASIGGPSQAPSKLRTGGQSSLISSRNRHGVDARDSL